MFSMSCNVNNVIGRSHRAEKRKLIAVYFPKFSSSRIKQNKCNFCQFQRYPVVSIFFRNTIEVFHKLAKLRNSAIMKENIRF